MGVSLKRSGKFQEAYRQANLISEEEMRNDIVQRIASSWLEADQQAASEFLPEKLTEVDKNPSDQKK